MDISIQLELTSNVIGCGGISTLRTLVVNSSVAYTFSTAEVRDNCHFNATITTYNATEVMILNITLPISKCFHCCAAHTHDYNVIVAVLYIYVSSFLWKLTTCT